MRFAPAVLAANMAACALLVLTAATSAWAQAPEPRVFVTVGGGMQGGGSAATDRLEWDVDHETATATIDYEAGASRVITGGLGVRLWRRVGAGVAFSDARREEPASIDARIPHPFFFEQPREINGESASLSRSETSVHVQVLYIVPSTGRARIILSAGPSRIRVEQGVVTAVHFTEEYPFDDAAFDRADAPSRSATAVGFNAGADVAYMFTRAIGVAGMARFSRAKMDLVRPDGGRFSIEAGGMQGALGLRFAF